MAELIHACGEFYQRAKPGSSADYAWAHLAIVVDVFSAPFGLRRQVRRDGALEWTGVGESGVASDLPPQSKFSSQVIKSFRTRPDSPAVVLEFLRWLFYLRACLNP